MILYSKSGDFLGIGKDELSFLGYEDLDEFKSIYSDVADLFINRPGYIFKFKNFSWIDYALHSGAPKKSVIIKLKTGNEVEVAIKIKELFLYNPKENEELYYSIEFVNNMSQNSSSRDDSTFIQATPTPKIQTSTLTDETPPIEEVLPDVTDLKEVLLEEEFTQKEPQDLSIDFNPAKEEEPVPKLKIDNSVFAIEDNLTQEEETKQKLSANDEFTEDYENVELPKLKIDLTSEETSFKPMLDISSDYDEKTEEIANFETSNDISFDSDDEEENVDFDLVNCVEELGLDISLVGELITDYMDKIDQNITNMKTSIENEDEELLKQTIYNLKGISDNLHMTQLSSRLKNILEANDIDTKTKELEKFKKLVAKFKSELI